MDAKELERLFGGEHVEEIKVAHAASVALKVALKQMHEAKRKLGPYRDEESANGTFFRASVARRIDAYNAACDEHLRLVATLRPKINTYGDEQVPWLYRHGLAG